MARVDSRGKRRIQVTRKARLLNLKIKHYKLFVIRTSYGDEEVVFLRWEEDSVFDQLPIQRLSF